MSEQMWERYFRTRGVDERDALIVHYLPLVKSVVGRMVIGLPSQVSEDDLYSCGVSGLIRAVEKYDQDKNTKFESYANLLIKGAVIDEMRRLDWIPRSVHQKIARVKNAMDNLQQKLGRDPLDSELAEYLGINAEEFEDLLHRIRPIVLLPLNANRFLNDNEDGSELSDVIADEYATSGYDEARRKEFAVHIECALKKLNPQQQKVMKYYYYDELMLKEIAKKMQISESRVSQIHTAALLRLKFQLEPLKQDF